MASRSGPTERQIPEIPSSWWLAAVLSSGLYNGALRGFVTVRRYLHAFGIGVITLRANQIQEALHVGNRCAGMNPMSQIDDMTAPCAGVTQRCENLFGLTPQFLWICGKERGGVQISLGNAVKRQMGFCGCQRGAPIQRDDACP